MPNYWQSLSPEWKILCLASRIRLNSDEKQALSQLCQGNIKWDLLLKLVNYHGVCNLVLLNLLPENQALIPANTQKELRQIRLRVITHNLCLQKQLLEIYKIFDRNTILALPIKGITLSQLIYDDLTFRHSRDIDILIKRDELIKCNELLLKENYIPISPNQDIRNIPEDYLFRKSHSFTYMTPDKKAYIDLHWSLSELPYLSSDLFFDAKETSTIMVCNRAIKIVSLQDTLLYLYLHCAMSQRQRLIWLCDIANIFRLHQGKINFSEMYAQVNALRLERPIKQILFMTNYLFSTPMPNDVNLDEIEDDLPVKIMIKITNSKLIYYPNMKETILSKIKNLFLSHCHRFLLKTDFKYKLTYLRDLIQPGMLDIPTWLPRNLLFIAYFLRPFGIIVRRLK